MSDRQPLFNFEHIENEDVVDYMLLLLKFKNPANLFIIPCLAFISLKLL
jgi:hypothetical protein